MDQQELYHVEWRKSGYCDGGACVEVAKTPDGQVAVRDGKYTSSSLLLFAPGAWASFTSAAKRSIYDPERIVS
jgi:hypothetical protein